MSNANKASWFGIFMYCVGLAAGSFLMSHNTTLNTVGIGGAVGLVGGLIAHSIFE